ncbi:MAG: flagellar assembly peptidoglycan hydrolase FlgJ [Gammaproteobacteria bacterium]|nr:flagellar assembly peptidoglycan hydrolase FlgJ [Gammaproteobacteria bacterium]NNJ96635.1 flagellar assembly peptidoglycan hydrolase FlgJ [Gammaproteobacteria bacterium]
MNNELANTALYSDMSGLTRLRARAAERTPDANKEVARQFEALFVQSMLKAMRQASLLSESTDGEQTRFYQDMFDKQIALDLARKNSIGLAPVIERQLSGQAIGRQPAGKSDALSRVTGNRMQISNAATDARWQPESQEAFIRDLWPHAQKSAKELGVNADVLIAQAALETGWGRKMIHDQQGGNAFNLFGIKAGKDWQGEQAVVSTIEYRDGIAQREIAAFRSYASLQQSMDDYVAFLKQNPRYRPALEKAGNSQEFLQQLQRAGYATDPAYADKISDIMKRETFSKVVSDLRQAADTTNLQNV